jgi:mannose/cellobiose epimerase-like protein (N-acyl-D-glucosamine 2-epimerase family)
MKRRALLLGGGLLPAAALAAASRADGGTEPAGQGGRPHAGDDRTRLAGMTLPELRARYHRELFEVVLPFWDAHGIDRERGGFICALDHDGTRLDTDKLLVFQGRGLWVWSTLYRQFGRAQEHLAVARETCAFCLEHMRRSDGSWRSRVAADGRPVDAPDADLSAQLCLAEGLHAYSEATGDDALATLARAVLLEAVARGTAPGAPSRQGFWFLTLLACTGMLSRRADAGLERLAHRAAEALVAAHYNPETGLHDELLSPDLGRSPTDAGFTIFGHSVEGLWMLMDHALRIGDESLFDQLATRLKRHLDVGWDRIYGGLAHAVRVDRGGFVWPVERPLGTVAEFHAVGEYHYMKSYWSLAEVLVATLKVLERRRAPWAADYFGLAQGVLDERLSLAPLGHPLYTLFTDRRLTRGTRTGRAENYHHPRMLMANLLTLDRMIAGERDPA